MKNYVKSLREVIGFQSDIGYYTPVTTNNKTLMVPNFLPKNEEDIYPKIILRAFISYLPISKGVDEDNNLYFTTHQGRIQIDIYSTDDSGIEIIDISDEINERFNQFFEKLEIISFKDPYEWEEHETIKVNPNYEATRKIFKYGNYIKQSNIEGVISTPNSWFLDNTGLYVNGDINKEILEVVDGMIFTDGTTIQQRGFIGINFKTPLRELEADSIDQSRYSLQYDVLYNSYRNRKVGNVIDEINVQGEINE